MQMEDNALNKDHSNTTSMPNHMAELGSGNFDQELTLTLLGSEEDALGRIDGRWSGSMTAAMASARRAARRFPSPALTLFHIRHCASGVPRNGKKATAVEPRAAWLTMIAKKPISALPICNQSVSQLA